MVSIAEASQQALLARQQLESKQGEVRVAQDRLRQVEQNLPKVNTQRSLRQTIGAGLKGMLTRQKVTQAKQAIGKQQGVLSQYDEQLRQYETEQLAPVEAQIRDVQARESAWNLIQKAAADGQVWAYARYGEGYVQQYAKQYLEQQNLAQEAFARDVTNIQSSLPEGDRLVVDYKNMRLQGVESNTLGGSFSVKDYNQAVDKFNANIKNLPEIQSVKTELFKAPLQERDVPTMSRLRAITGNIISSELIPRVSASPTSSNESLNIKGDTFFNESSIPNSIYNREISGLGSSQQSRDSNSGFVSNVVGYFKKGFEDQTEIYSPQLGGFVQASPTGGQATAFIRQPTERELVAIQRAEYLGSWKGIKTEVPAFFDRQFARIQNIPAVRDIRNSDFIKGLNNVRLPEPRQQGSTWLSPEGVKKPFDWLAEKTLWSGEQAGRGTKKVVDLFGANQSGRTYQFLFNPEKNIIPRQTAKEVISSAYMFSAVEPFVRTGTYQQSVYADEVVEVVYKGQRVKMTRSQAEAQGLIATRTQAVGEFGRMPKEEQLKIIKKAFENRVYIDQVSLQADLARSMTFMKEAGLTNKQIANILKKIPQVRQFQTSTVITGTSEGRVAEDVIASTSTRMSGKTVMESTDEFFGGVKGVELRGVSAAETFSSTLEPSSVGETNWMSYSATDFGTNAIQENLNNQRSKIGVNMLGSLKTNQDYRQKTKQRQEPLLRNLSANLPRLDLRTTPKTVQTPKQVTRQVQDPLIGPRPEPRPRPKPRPRPEDPLKPKLPRLNQEIKKKRIMNIQKSKGDDFLAITKRRGKEIVVGRTKTPEKAAQLARLSALGTLGATAKVRTTSGKQIKLREDKIFRTSKTDPLAVVQRKEARLSSLGERREIKQTKRRPFRI